jgi:hypothetical protein
VGFSIRPAVVDDAAGIAAVNAVAGKAGWSGFLPSERLAAVEPSVGEWQWRLSHAEPSTVFVATRAEAIVGFASVTRRDDTGPASAS